MNLDFFKPKAPPLFGLDISSSSVKMLEIVDAGRGAHRVARGYKRLATRTKHVAMAVPSGAVITKKIIVQAGLRDEELEQQVESEANQYIPFALEEVNLDFQVVGPAPSNTEEVEVLLAASRKANVEDRVAVAEAAGLKA